MIARSSSQNPGAFQARSVRGPRAIAGRALRELQRGRAKLAAMDLVADCANWIEANAAYRLRARFQCSCCGARVHAFHHVVSRGIAWNSACPSCDSRSRHRGLAFLIPELVKTYAPRNALHFAPESVLRPCFAPLGNGYETADLYLEDVTHPNTDLQRLHFADRSYDLTICNHVLEHVPDEEAALRELGRVTRGLAVITVPGDFSRRDTKHFSGELVNGHYRDYGTDFEQRLAGFFEMVRVVDLHAYDADASGLSHGIRERDLAFVCSR